MLGRTHIDGTYCVCNNKAFCKAAAALICVSFYPLNIAQDMRHSLVHFNCIIMFCGNYFIRTEILVDFTPIHDIA